MLRNSRACLSCPGRTLPHCVPGEGAGSGLAIIGETPGRTETATGHPFVGMSGQLLRETLKQLNIDPATVWITNACLCIGRDHVLREEALPYCQERLKQELRAEGIQKALLCGNTAAQALIPEAVGVATDRLRLRQLTDPPIVALATYHPAAVLRMPGFFPDFVFDIERLVASPQPLPPHVRVPYTVVDSTEAFAACLAALLYNVEYQIPIALDIETTGLDSRRDRMISLGMAVSATQVYILPEEFLQNHSLRGVLARIFNDPEAIFVGHNAQQFDALFLEKYGLNLVLAFDTMLAHYCIDERGGGSGTESKLSPKGSMHGLKTLAMLYCNAPAYGEGVKKNWEWMIRPENRQTLYQYQSYDCSYTWQLEGIFREKLELADPMDVHGRLLLPAAQALAQVEKCGICVDLAYLKELDQTLQAQEATLLERIQADASSHGFNEFNPRSPKQVASLLYDQYRLRAVPTNFHRGQSPRSTNRDMLSQMDHPIAKAILEYRTTGKLRATYVENLQEAAAHDGRVHTEFMLTGSVTGRLASRNPNLQNIPQLVGPMIRNAFVASDGYIMIEADYSQLELRVAAHYSGEPELLQAFAEGRDLHRLAASIIFQVPFDSVTHEQRHRAKFVNFGIIYGRGADSLAKNELQCSVIEARQYINNFFRRMPRLKEWLRNQRALVHEAGEVSTPMGRRRRFGLIVKSMQDEAERQGINAPIQSLASDFCLTALTRLARQIDFVERRILLTVHDSILFECFPDDLDAFIDLITHEMVDNIPIQSQLRFPIDLKVGQRWGALQKYTPGGTHG